MKKVDFLNLVCAELARLGVEDAEIGIQRQNTDRYLSSNGIDEESPKLDKENPVAFARLICGNIQKKRNAATNITPASNTAVPPSEPKEHTVPEFAEELPNVDAIVTNPAAPQSPEPTFESARPPQIISEPPVNTVPETVSPVFDDEDDVKIFGGHASAPPKNEIPFEDQTVPFTDAEPIPTYENVPANDPTETFDENVYAPADLPQESTYEYNDQSNFDAEPYYPQNEYAEEYGYPADNSDGTIEFDVTPIKKKTELPPTGELEEGEDYFEKNDDEDYAPSGNPVLFWVLAGLTCFLWIPLLALLALGIAVAFVFLIAFEVVYIPSIIAVIIGGSAVTFAELIYSIIKFAGKNPAVALFELGLGCLVAALTFGLPTLMYYLGVSIFPKCIKNYGKNVGKLFRKLRRLYRKLKGACSI